MKINQVLVESAAATVAFAFGRFNPAHQGHIEVWRAVEEAGKNWFIGTNPSTLGPNDPLTFQQKSAWMEEIYPPIAGHIVAEQSVLTLAAYIFKKLRKNERATVAYITDANDWAWSGKLLNQYNGVEGAHGYYKFAQIIHEPSPRVSSATALRDAARADDKVAFYHASGTDPKSKVAGLTYFDTVKQAVEKYPLPVKRGQKVKEEQLNELAGYGSDKGYKKLDSYKRYDVYVSKQKFNNLYYIAVAENPRSLTAKFKAKGKNPQEAVQNLHAEVDKEIDVATKVSGRAIIDFNVDFVRDILELSTDTFYAKIIPGPKLVLAGPEMMEYPEIMSSEGFKPSAIRTYKGGEGTTKLPGVPLSASAAVTANLIANGRYVLGNEEIDKDGNRVFDLEFDSVVQDKNEKLRLRAPALTIGTNRVSEVAEDDQKTVAKTWDQMTPKEKSSGVKGRTVWNEKTRKYYTIFDVPVTIKEDEEAGEVKKTGQLIPFPAGTTKVHVSDVYDWYKLGMVISDLDDADPAMFGQGAPQSIIAFGSEEEESKLLPLLQRLGLKVDDIDPEGTDEIGEAYHAGSLYEMLKKERTKNWSLTNKRTQ